jgi:hypothetical protein
MSTATPDHIPLSLWTSAKRGRPIEGSGRHLDRTTKVGLLVDDAVRDPADGV